MKKFIITLFVILFMPISVLAEDINVAFTIDNNYPLFTLLAINSILQNNKSDSHYNFYVIEDNITANNKELMSEYVKKRNQSIEFINIDTDIIDGGVLLFSYLKRITPIGMARIMLPKLLDTDIHNVLYLDSDILVTGDLKNLYDIDLCGFPAGLALNITQLKALDGHRFKNGYYNSGVILMDLDMWRKEHISDKMLTFIKDNKDKFLVDDDGDVIFMYPDQDLINIVLNGKIKALPQRWNTQTIRNEVLGDAGGIIHFIGGMKPWAYPLRPNEYMKLYYKYWGQSGLRAYKWHYAFKGLKNNYLYMLAYSRYRFLKFRYKFYKLFEKPEV